MSQAQVFGAYGALASDIVAMLGTNVSQFDPDRAIIEDWAGNINGRILDVGSGTGRWTGHLAHLGHDMTGLEPVPELVNAARRAHPGVPFRPLSIADLAGTPAEWSGILAWYSLIHMPPHDMHDALATLGSVLKPGGTLLLSYFTGDTPEAFKHPIAPAYRWPAQDITDALAAADFDVVTHWADPPRPHAIVLARTRALKSPERFG